MALTATVLPTAHETAQKVEAAGGTPEQVRAAAWMAAGVQAALSTGGTKAAKTFLGQALPKLTKDLIAMEAAGHVGSMTGERAAKLIRDQALGAIFGPQERIK